MAKKNMANVEEAPQWELDVVCGMDVDPRTTPYHYAYKGKYYHFCNKNCLEHFVNDPEHYLLMEPYHVQARKKRQIS